MFLGWWFQNIFNIYPHLGKWFNLTNIFQSGWNHQLVLQVLSICVRTFPLKGLFRCQNDLSKKLRSPEVVPMAPRIMSRSCCWPNKFSWSLAFASCFFLTATKYFGMQVYIIPILMSNQSPFTNTSCFTSGISGRKDFFSGSKMFQYFFSGWWQLKYFAFSSLFEEMIHFD